MKADHVKTDPHPWSVFTDEHDGCFLRKLQESSVQTEAELSVTGMFMSAFRSVHWFPDDVENYFGSFHCCCGSYSLIIVSFFTKSGTGQHDLKSKSWLIQHFTLIIDNQQLFYSSLLSFFCPIYHQQGFCCKYGEELILGNILTKNIPFAF